jgi:hypothetical protein
MLGAEEKLIAPVWRRGGAVTLYVGIRLRHPMVFRKSP